MNPNQGFAFIGHLLTSHKAPQAAVLPVDWSQFAQRIPGAADWSTLRRLVPSGGSNPLTGNSADTAAARVKEADGAKRVDLICAYLLERIAQTLRVPAADLDENAELSTLGVDSLTAVELRIWVQGDLDLDLSVEQLFTTPSIRDLALAMSQMLDGDGASAPALQDQPRWLIRPQPRPAAACRLICFPYAGGGASAFRDWAGALPERLELNVVQLPGREERIGESAMTDMSALIDRLANEIAPLADRPFAFFGHSMGAVICYEVARRLAATGAAQPAHLFLSARAAPHLEKNGQLLSAMGDDAFIERLHQTYGAVPDAIRNNAELRDVFLPILRADVTLLETHEDLPEPLLDCPITVIGGANDPAITGEMLAGWRVRTTGGFAQHEFPGDHFFLHTVREAVISVVAEALHDTGDA